MPGLRRCTLGAWQREGWHSNPSRPSRTFRSFRIWLSNNASLIAVDASDNTAGIERTVPDG